MEIKPYSQIVEELEDLHKEIFEKLPGLVESSVKENIYKGSQKFSITLEYTKLPSSIEKKIVNAITKAGYKNITLNPHDNKITISFHPELF